MTRTEFVEFLNEIGADYEANSDYFKEGYDGIWIFGKTEDGYTEELRVSDFERGDSDGDYYTKNWGICKYRNIDWIINKAIKLTKERKAKRV